MWDTHSRSLTLSLSLHAVGRVLPSWGQGQVKVTQSCLTLCDPVDYTVHGILQARILEWVAVPFSRGSSQPRDQTQSPTLQADLLPAEPPGKPSLGQDHIKASTGEERQFQ